MNKEKKAERNAFVIHGILGNKRNWRSFINSLAKGCPKIRFILVDLRNHGSSPGFSPPHNLGASARDVIILSEKLKLDPMY